MAAYGDNTCEMGGADRPQRSDAARNRQRLLEAATAVFGERGLDAGVGEIAARAGVGRGTLFRNFPTKQDLIAAIVVERMRAAMEEGRELLRSGDGEIVFAFMDTIVSRQQSDRALFEAIDDAFLVNAEIRAAHDEFIALMDDMLEQGKRAGVVRPEVGAVDVMMLVKGVCSAATALEASPALLARHLDLIRSAISTPAYVVPLRGETPTVADLEAALTPPPAAAA
jgi:AcrR family transcriptional regulator